MYKFLISKPKTNKNKQYIYQLTTHGRRIKEFNHHEDAIAEVYHLTKHRYEDYHGMQEKRQKGKVDNLCLKLVVQ